MKFLCRNCKAKYQIADEKVAGRTLRMTCQQCGEPIVVRGPARQAAATGGRAVVAPAAIGATGQNAMLSGDLAHHLASPARETGGVNEEWHVAVNDAPVGPLRRDEVARMIAQGAVDRESLAWREGMDDWVPVRHIAELATLFAPSVVPARGGTSPISVQPSAIHATGTTRGDVAPIGGRQVVPVEDYAPALESDPPAEVAVATVQPNVQPAPPPPVVSASSRPPSWAQSFLLVSGGAFILAMGAWLGARVLAPTAAPPAVAAAPAAAAAAPATPQEPIAREDKDSDGAGNVIELDMQAIDGASANNAARKAPSPSSNGPSASAQNSADKKKGGGLTAEQKEMLERMGGGFSQGPAAIRAPSETARGSGAQGAGALTAEQLSSVVSNGKKHLQRCYETALRGSNSQETVRLDVDIQVSPSGNVTSVHTSGKGLPGMDDCITRTVKMWRFPMSAEVTQTRFPVVFQPGA